VLVDTGKNHNSVGVIGPPGTSEQQVGQGQGQTGERKGDIGTWASSTEVCPWEDE
jgi:hypothetical protein